MAEKIKNLVRIAVLSLIFSAAIGSALANWSPPAGTPPFNNIPPPINVGAATQEKAGNLFLGNWLIAKKAQVVSPTVSGDNRLVLATKGYVDDRVSSISGMMGGFGQAYIRPDGSFGGCRNLWGVAYCSGGTVSCGGGYSRHGLFADDTLAPGEFTYACSSLEDCHTTLVFCVK